MLSRYLYVVNIIEMKVKSVSPFEILFLKVPSFILQNYMSWGAVQITYFRLSYSFNVRNTIPIFIPLIPPTYSNMLRVACFYDNFSFIFDTRLKKKNTQKQKFWFFHYQCWVFFFIYYFIIALFDAYSKSFYIHTKCNYE